VFKFFWYKQRISKPWLVSTYDMEKWCYANLGDYGKRWYVKFYNSPYTYLFDAYELRFKYQEDLRMFRVCNLYDR